MFNSEFVMSNIFIAILSALIVVYALFLARKEDRESAEQKLHDAGRERLAS
jgi:hypothetical protein